LANAIPSGGGVLGDWSDILSGDLRIEIGRSEFDEACNLSQAGSSSQLLHGLRSRSLGHLHRRHHHVQVPVFSLCPLFLLCQLPQGRAWLPRKRNYMFQFCACYDCLCLERCKICVGLFYKKEKITQWFPDGLEF
jgi:hypothetical protein